jgi:hypothetical protein
MWDTFMSACDRSVDNCINYLALIHVHHRYAEIKGYGLRDNLCFRYKIPFNHDKLHGTGIQGVICLHKL